MKRSVHIRVGQAGVQFANRQPSVAIIVDVLRSSTTLALLFQKGIACALVFSEVADLLSQKGRFPDCLLIGERGGLKVPGFDFNNSPTEVDEAENLSGKIVLFTSTTGARLLNLCHCPAVLVGCPANGSAVAATARGLADQWQCPIVLVAAGVWGRGEEWALEDIASAWHLSDLIKPDQVMGPDRPDGDLVEIFHRSLHGQVLLQLGLSHDLHWCARKDVVSAVPAVSGRGDGFVEVKDWSRPVG